MGNYSRGKPILTNNIIHDSSEKCLTGDALYIDDINLDKNACHGYIGFSSVAHGYILDIDFSLAMKTPGVLDIITYKELPGSNDISPTGKNDEPILSNRKVNYYGQPIFLIVATTREIARTASKLVKIKYEELKPIVTIKAAKNNIRNLKFVTEPLRLKRGNFEKAFKKSPKKLVGEIEIGGQDHFYLEGHIALAIPTEGGEIRVLSSTQHPSEVQHMVAKTLDLPSSSVEVAVRRMGGGFGGKETQSNLFAVLASVAAIRLGRTVKIRPDRDDDMIITGKRHPFLAKYEVGFEENGKINALKATLSAQCGYSADLSGPITDRALFHVDNCYYIPDILLESEPLFTNTVSNTAFRGFGGPQGMLVGERVIEEIAFSIAQDPLEVRKINLYGIDKKNITPYHQKVRDNISRKIISELEKTSGYKKRRRQIISFNKKSKLIKKGISLTPVKFGISFTATWYNQAGALINIYNDGSVSLNHGGTEMGQGLNTKVSSIVSEVFCIPFEQIKITQTETSKIPNTSATAASSGSDLNGKAAERAALTLKDRLIKFASKHFTVPQEFISFGYNGILVGNKLLSFSELVSLAYKERVQLSALGFYKTPNIYWDRAKGKGEPFYYFAYGAAVSEVSLDTLTGEYILNRTDILHDVGQSLNEYIDIGQIEGGFIQGVGWLTSEELVWDDSGSLKTHAPSTYKIPLASDTPETLNISLLQKSPNPRPTVKRSKAVGEPPFMLSISVFEALSMAVSSVIDYSTCPKLRTPATPENLLLTIEKLKRQNNAKRI